MCHQIAERWYQNSQRSFAKYYPESKPKPLKPKFTNSNPKPQPRPQRKRKPKAKAPAKPRLTPAENYVLYLQGEHWQATRLAALESQGRKCQSCDGGFFLHVHHRTYANIGHELPEDLVVLCDWCHKELHTLAKEKTFSVEVATDTYLGSTFAS